MRGSLRIIFSILIIGVVNISTYAPITYAITWPFRSACGEILRNLSAANSAANVGNLINPSNLAYLNTNERTHVANEALQTLLDLYPTLQSDSERAEAVRLIERSLNQLASQESIPTATVHKLLDAIRREHSKGLTDAVSQAVFTTVNEQLEGQSPTGARLLSSATVGSGKFGQVMAQLALNPNVNSSMPTEEILGSLDRVLMNNWINDITHGGGFEQNFGLSIDDILLVLIEAGRTPEVLSRLREADAIYQQLITNAQLRGALAHHPLFLPWVYHSFIEPNPVLGPTLGTTLITRAEDYASKLVADPENIPVMKIAIRHQFETMREEVRRAVEANASLRSDITRLVKGE